MIDYGFEENKDFTLTKIRDGRITKNEYAITIDMAKEIELLYNMGI